MGVLIETRGADQLDFLSRRLRAAGRTDLRREMVKHLRAEAKEITDEQKRRVRSLAHAPSEWKRGAAKALRTRIRTTGDGIGVKIYTPNTIEGKRGRLLNRGKWRHPHPRSRRFWYPQVVKPDWFDGPTKDAGRRVRQRLLAVMRRIARKIEG